MTVYHYYAKKYNSDTCVTDHISGVIYTDEPVGSPTDYANLLESVHQAIGDDDNIVIASLTRL